MKSVSLKNYVPYIVAVLAFIVISYAYFTPDIFQNKTLYQHDGLMGMGIGQEAKQFQEQTGEKTLWTNSLFGGMPTYQISPSYPSLTILKEMQQLSWLYLASPASILFILLFGVFLLFIALRVNPWLAIIGAIAYAFSSYFFIIIQAGHIWKVWVLAYIPPTFAGIIWAYRGKYWLGAFVTAFYMALQLLSNHPQMTYYFGILVLIFIVGEFIHSIKTKQLANFFKATAVLLVGVGIAFALNITNLYHTADYSKYSMRGGSELAGNEKDKTKNGLERSYITGWSYGIGETFTLLVPNTKGGSSSNYIGYKLVDTPEGKTLVKDPNKNKNRLNSISNPQIREYIEQQPYYWGDQPGTSGPVYVGAFILFLFVLGIFIVRGWFKWVLVIGTALSILLSWGSNFMWFTDLFLAYFPFYSKMRAVSSILVIAELCIPILAILALKEIIDNSDIIKEKKKQLYITLGCTAGLILVVAVAPRLFFSFLSEQEKEGFGEMLKNPQAAPIYSELMDELENIRISIFRADAFRSLLIICIGVVAVLLFSLKKISLKIFIVFVAALILFDMWQINKRYLSSNDFKPKTTVVKLIPKTPIDEEILKDESLDYRVFNLSASAFNDGETSFYHKSIGGYHGAKLRRYQDIIERYLAGITAKNVQGLMGTPYFNVLNMLNTKYIITSKDGAQQLLRNPHALGNAWFVDSITWVSNADDEIAALATNNPATKAIIDKRFESELSGFKPNQRQATIKAIDGDSLNLSGNDAYFYDNSTIKLIQYQPNKLVYKANTISQKLTVFSEIYYPNGWHAYIDGNEATIFRVNYILRGMLIPEGEHTIEFRFNPASYPTTERMAWLGYALLAALLLITITFAVIRKKNDGKQSA